jgi:glycosyltransferase involved in cell wall biosynthesis
MKVLALEPYYGGSHKAFIDNFSSYSRHDWTLLTLPAYKWKWRMRHSAITFADQVKKLIRQNQNWDLIFCSDMLNLAEFKGLAPKQITMLPAIVYFHENQLTYPIRFEDERDFQFAMTNITTALAADRIWFNSKYHRNSFINAIEKFLKKMPDNQPQNIIDVITKKASVHYPGINEISKNRDNENDKPVILYCARFEHDKNPDDFFQALKSIKDKGFDFKLNVIGEQFRDQPEVFKWAKDFFKDNIIRWGYQESRDEYEKALSQSDIVVSTAHHEFFGISIVEAISAGAYPLLPTRLSYPELLDLENDPVSAPFFYDDTVNGLTEKLESLFILHTDDEKFRADIKQAKMKISRFFWKNIIFHYDKTLETTGTTQM